MHRCHAPRAETNKRLADARDCAHDEGFTMICFFDRHLFVSCLEAFTIDSVHEASVRIDVHPDLYSGACRRMQTALSRWLMCCRGPHRWLWWCLRALGAVGALQLAPL